MKRVINLTLIFLTILCVIWRLLESWPPSKLVIASGPKGGFYDTTSLEIQRLLKLKGIAVEIVSYTQTSKIISDVNDAQSNLDIGFLVQAVAPSAYPNLMS